MLNRFRYKKDMKEGIVSDSDITSSTQHILLKDIDSDS